MNPRTLYVHPYPPPAASIPLLKAAKAAMALDYQVVMVAAQEGCEDRILSFGSPPNYLCLTGIVSDVNSQHSIAGALSWVLSSEPEQDEHRGFGFSDYIGSLMGRPVVEHPSEIVEGNVVRFK